MKISIGIPLIAVPPFSYGVYSLMESTAPELPPKTEPKKVEGSDSSDESYDSEETTDSPQQDSGSPQPEQTQTQTHDNIRSSHELSDEDKNKRKEEGKNEFLNYLEKGTLPQYTQKIKEFFKERFGDENIWRLYHNQWKECGACTWGFSYPAVDWGVSNWLYGINKHHLYGKINWDYPPQGFNAW